MYQRGDHVGVRGFGGHSAVLLVWDVRPKGLLLCTEDGFGRLTRGKDAPVIGFPLSDIVGIASDKKEVV